MNFSGFQLGGKCALVTGSARGLGRAISLELARQGASLVLADTLSPGETARAIEDVGARCLSIQSDVSDEASVRNMVDEALSAFGRVDILVNNAGITQTEFAPTEDTAVETWDRVIQVNLRSTFVCSKYVGKTMIHNGGGSIICIASTAGVTGVPRAAAYCASKAGVILLTKSLALEWAKHNIRVNAIAPHYLETELTRELRASEKVYEGLVRQIPMRRFGKMEEIVGTVLLLASPASSYVTGSVFVIDGGYLAQ